LSSEGYQRDAANPRDLTVQADVDLDLELDLLHNRSGQSITSGSRRPWQPRDRPDEIPETRLTQHDRMPSDASLAESSSIKSSSLSHSFVDSPALAISARVPNPTASQHVQQLLETSDDSSLTPPPPRTNQTYLVSPPTQPATSHLLDAPFLALMEETKDVLAGPDFARVLEVCLDTATEVLFDGLEKNIFKKVDVKGKGKEREGELPEEPEEVERVRLAGLLPGLSRWSQLALQGLPNELVDVSQILCLFDLNLTVNSLENAEYERSCLFVCYHLCPLRG